MPPPYSASLNDLEERSRHLEEAIESAVDALVISDGSLSTEANEIIPLLYMEKPSATLSGSSYVKWLQRWLAALEEHEPLLQQTATAALGASPGKTPLAVLQHLKKDLGAFEGLAAAESPSTAGFRDMVLTGEFSQPPPETRNLQHMARWG